MNALQQVADTGHVKRSIATSLLILFLFPIALSAQNIKERIKEKQAAIHHTHLEIREKKRELTKSRIREDDLRRQLDATNISITEVDAKLRLLGAQVLRNQRKLVWNTLQLDAAKATLTRHNQALRRRMLDAYEHGDLGYLNVLLTSTSFNDFVERWDDIGYLITANERAVRERQDAQRHVAALEHSFEREQQALEESLARQRQARYAFTALAQTRQGLLIASENQRREVTRQVVALEEISAQEEATLEGLIVQRQNAEKVRREIERRAALLAGKAIPPSPSTGSYNWPVSGPITSPFGYRSDPYGNAGGSEFHTGIDIAAPMGATVTATAAGTVIYATWYGGYGNAIIIDHGNGISSLYGHLSQIFIADHQEVQQGQAIGAIGSTGRSTGPHLHFEIRSQGQPIDPTSRLR